MADTKDILNQLGATNTNLNDMHAIKKAIGGGGSGKYNSDMPVKIGEYTLKDGRTFELRKCIFEVSQMGNSVPADLLSSLDIANIINLYAISNNGQSFVTSVRYNLDTRQISLDQSAIWCEKIIVEYIVYVED